MSIAIESIQTYSKLAKIADGCRRCPMMEFRRTFLNEHNGPVPADVMFIGEATNVGLETQLPKPMWDSPSGNNLNNLLNSIGLNREQVFVTNTVLHTPVVNPNVYPGQMRYVTEEEQVNCSSFLLKQIELVNPKIICTLGNKALSGLHLAYAAQNKALLQDSRAVLKQDVGKCMLTKDGRWLIPLYHPSPTVIASWRNMAQQSKDYSAIKFLLDKMKES